MGNKRDRLEIIFEILSIIKDNKNSIKPTPLLRFSNLSFSSFNQYFQELLEKKFIIEIEDKKGKKFISLTEKGFNFLSKYYLIKNFIKDFDLD